jgi:23S rRNA (cytosine1962-C5)-methyltransferase
MNVLRLKRREERRVLAGHGWIFSNEIDTDATPLKGLEPGSDAVIEGSDGRFVAHAYVNPASLISARVTGRRRNRPFDDEALRARLNKALALRERRYSGPWYRWVYSEADGLPGLVIDRYDDIAVVQVSTAGMEQRLDAVIAAIKDTTDIRSVLLRNDAAVRELEGLSSYRRWEGESRDVLSVVENELRFEVPSELSQKTGWFYDHRETRRTLRDWVKGRRVLDLYSYAGAFAINAAAAGATEVLAIDSSASATAAIEANAALNEVSDRVSVRTGDVVTCLRELQEVSELFDVVVLDPPAFVKRRRDRDAGMKEYGRVNRLAMKLLSPDGLLVSASCSQSVDEDAVVGVLRRNLPRERDLLQVLGSVTQAPDHPVHPAMPETRYLSGVIARIA